MGARPIVWAYVSGQPGAGLRAESFSRPRPASAGTRRSQEECSHHPARLSLLRSRSRLTVMTFLPLPVAETALGLLSSIDHPLLKR